MPTRNNTRAYEAMFLVDTGDAAVWDDLTKHIESILTRSGAELIGITRWDERKLAYPVAKHKRGTYVLAFFHMAGGDGVAEIEHDCRLSEKVVRAMVLKADHFTVADMRQQLGEDIREDVARKVMDARGEKEPPPPEPEPKADDKPPADETAQTPSTDEPSAKEPSAEETPAEETPAEEPPAEETAAGKPADAQAPPPEPPEAPKSAGDPKNEST